MTTTTRTGGVVGLAGLFGALLACEPLMDGCELTRTGPAVAFDEVGAPGFAAADVLLPAGTYTVDDGGYHLTVTLGWADTATPRTWKAVDGDRDGVVHPASCPMDYAVRGTIAVDSGDGRYDERGAAEAVASEGGATRLWVVVDDDDVRGDEVPGRELWLEIWEDADGAWFGLTAIGVGGEAEYLVSAPLVPAG